MPVLRAFSMQANKGAFIAVTGKNGSGKTTLLHILCGLLSVDSGLIRVAGRELSAMSRRERCAFRAQNTGVVFQDGNLVDHFSVLENVMLPYYLTRRKIDKPAQERAEEVLRDLNLTELKNRDIRALSGGQRQKAAIARALLLKPEIIFADEPTGSLDREAETEIMEIFRAINRQGTTIIMVTHSEKCADYANKIIELGVRNEE
ncbi:MAG: ABC transporter ATP-binding protein [Firmicutes bacterium]|nr:ABC transporter ATP-binding protein [Bacillota bacterium]